MKMTKNMASADRALRTLLAAVVLSLWATGSIGGTLALILGIVSVIFMVTSFVGWCPLYSLLGVATRRRRRRGGRLTTRSPRQRRTP